MENITPEFALPGFRFHPTEEELVDYYLKETALGKVLHSDIIGFLDIYKHDPWDLPGMAKMGEREWYFFVVRERRRGHCGKASRITEKGYWNVTGSDRQIRGLKEPKKAVGLKKTLVFYTGKAPCGCRTDWVMNEYKLICNSSIPAEEDIVLCKVYRKATSLKVLEQRAAAAEELAQTSGVLYSNVAHNNFNTPLSLVVPAASEEGAEELSEAAKRETWKNNEPLVITSVGLGSMKEQQLSADQLSMDWELLDSTSAQQIFAMW